MPIGQRWSVVGCALSDDGRESDDGVSAVGGLAFVGRAATPQAGMGVPGISNCQSRLRSESVRQGRLIIGLLGGFGGVPGRPLRLVP
ncbi:MAG: hypothetical protein GC182_13885 [Rhodopseudomonas sp.]|nr:hypothetical protein [Rhodopseudomonas sp.]